MAQLANRAQSTSIQIAPGEVQTYRLPTMSPGFFEIKVTRQVVPLTTGKPGSPTGPGAPATSPVLRKVTDPGEIATGGFKVAATGPVEPPTVPPVTQPEQLVMDLLHGGKLVLSAAGFPPQATPSEGDDSWGLRVQLAPGSPVNEIYQFRIDITFPSQLAVLTRRVPLSFIQQGFDDNWNGRNYIFFNIDRSAFSVGFDPELANYYGIKDETFQLDLPLIEIDNVRSENIRLSTGSGPSPFSFIPGGLAYVQLDVPLVGADGVHPMAIKGPGGVNLFSLPSTTFTFRFYLIGGGGLGYATVFTSPLVDRLPDSVATIQVRQPVIDAVQNWLNQYNPRVSAALTPWFLGAAFDVWDVSHDANGTPMLGDLVIQYVGHEDPGSSELKEQRTSLPPVATVTPPAGVNPPGLTITTGNILAGATAGELYGNVVIAEGTPPYAWSASGLPAGLAISKTGVISGTPKEGGVASPVLKVVDSKGVAASLPCSMTVEAALLFTDPLYAPRGDGDRSWNPPKAPSVTRGGSTLGPGTTEGNLAKVDHIVVAMMENRSFDHMLGYLSREGGRTNVEGLKWENDSNRTQFNYYNGRYYYPLLLTDTQAIDTEAHSPDHSFENVKGQMADGMGHFVSDYAKTKAGDDPAQLAKVMGYYTGEQLPVYDMLAREFAICDHWFCSHPGPTWPNRFVTLTGDLNRDSYGEPEVNTPAYTDFTPSEAPTLFDYLTDRKVTWQYFQNRASVMRAFTKYSFDITNVLEFADTQKGFKAAVKAGLKSVTFVDPLFGDLPAGIGEPQDNDDAPPSDLKNGQAFISDLLSTLFTPADNPNWEKTMLIVVYDEHGGFYDHVDPPSDAAPLAGQNSGKLGPRVPAFVISPWTPAGLVLKDVFDHGTISATILRRFCSPHPPVMSARVSAARDLRDALPLKMARGEISPLFGLPNIVSARTPRAETRRFKAPKAPDAFGSVLGGIALTLGATPR